MTPCVLYTRVSTEEQARKGYSISFQKSRLAAFAASRDLNPVAHFEEHHTASKQGRPQFEVMLSFLRDNPAVRTVVVHKLDRLSRNILDWGALVEQLGVNVVPVEGPAGDAPMGWLTQTFGIGMAKFYSDNLSREVRKGLRAKFEAGGFVTRAPVGYLNVSRTRTTKATVVVDAEKAPLVQGVFERYATGQFSLARVAADAAADGLVTRSGRPYSAERIKGILKHPFYKGLTLYQGETRPGLHEAIVSERLWSAAQEVLSTRSANTGERGTLFFLLRGLLWCSCGSRLTAERHPRGSYYRCIAKREDWCKRYIPVGSLDRRIIGMLQGIQLTGEQTDSALNEMVDLVRSRCAERDRDATGMRTTLDRLEARLRRLTVAYADATVPQAEYVAVRDESLKKATTLRTKLALLEVDFEAELEAFKVHLETASNLASIYELADSDQDRKAVLAAVFKRIVVDNGTLREIEYLTPFDQLLGSDTQGSTK